MEQEEPGTSGLSHRIEAWRRTVQGDGFPSGAGGSMTIVMDPANVVRVAHALLAAEKEWQSAHTTASWGARRCDILIDVWRREVTRAHEVLHENDSPPDEDELKEWTAYRENAEAQVSRNAERKEVFQERVRKADESLAGVKQQQDRWKQEHPNTVSVFESGLAGTTNPDAPGLPGGFG